VQRAASCATLACPPSASPACPTRSLRLNPYATYVKNGILWGGGSDTGVTPFPARLGLWSSTARETSGGAERVRVRLRRAKEKFESECR
jgi:predicted amidohydrolase YtcJ